MQLLNIFKRSATAAVTPPVEQRGKRDLAVKLRGRNSGNILDAAEVDNTTASWNTFPLEPDALLDKLRTLVARSRQQSLSNDYVRAFLRHCRQNIVGENGIMLQALSQDNGVLDDLANTAIEEEWAVWGQAGNCDVTGTLSWLDVQNLAVTHAATDGDLFVQFVYGADAGPYGFALRLIDGQRCPPEYSKDGLPDGRFIRGGIEFSRYGRPLAYYFSAETRHGTYGFSEASLQRVPAEQVIHIMQRELIGLRRGIPWTNTGLYRMFLLQKFDRAASINATVGASKMGFIEYDEGFGPELDEEDELHVEVAPGVVQELPQGARYKSADHTYPAGEYGAHTKQQLRAASAGWGDEYSTLSGDLEGVNYSSIRQGTLDIRDQWKLRQGWLIRVLPALVFERWLQFALLSQRIKVKGRPLKAELIAKYRRVAWQGRRWTWIDPKSDVDAAVTAKNNGLTTPGRLIREQGGDPQSVWQELAADIAAMTAAGLPEWFIQQTLGKKPEPAAPAPKPPQQTS